tara:strand:- start:330 stop:632 length:303 start_codon:yes stop_codon:yes gene_type:complete
MKLLTEAIKKALPSLDQQDGLALEAVAYAKFFTPDANWTWYATEYSPTEGLFFGLVDGFEQELGYFSLSELESIKGSMGLPVERDTSFKPTKLSELKESR